MTRARSFDRRLSRIERAAGADHGRLPFTGCTTWRASEWAARDVPEPPESQQAVAPGPRVFTGFDVILPDAEPGKS